MQGKQDYSSLIYEYLLMKFRFQCYKYGDCLPSIDTLCGEFCVADQTVKAALRRLRAEGYLSMHNGKPTKVIFQQSEQERHAFASRFFAERQEAYSSLYQSTEMVMLPLLFEGFRRMTDKDFTTLSTLAKRASPGDLLHFYFYGYQKLGNPLVVNLLWETSLFWGFDHWNIEKMPDLYDEHYVRERLLTLLSQGAARQWDSLRAGLLSFQNDFIQNTIDVIARHVQPAPKAEQIPFTWRIYRDRSQVCYSLTSHMLYDIYLGEFSRTPRLPSYEQMARHYGVSVSTMRRTVRLLNQLGVARTVNGKGTSIYSIGENSAPPDFSCPAIRRNMALFFQSNEIVLYSCEEAVYTVLSALSRKEKGSLQNRLCGYLRDGRCDLTFWSIIITVAKRSPLQAVREIYSKIFGLLLWGYPLKSSGGEFAEFHQSVLDLTASFIGYLKENELGRCAAAVKQFVEREFPVMERYLIKLGIRPEELRTPPSIKLLLSED